tara:strand:+ start:149 stop:472 length:324 start_codon:yes stop_codon:yes gene_type:complete
MGDYITKKSKIDLSDLESLKNLKEKTSKYITKKEKKPEYITKKEKKPEYITKKKKDSGLDTDLETVSDSQKRGKMDLSKVINFRKGGSVKGCKLAKRGKGKAYGKNS